MADFVVPRLEQLTSQPEAEKLLKGFLEQKTVQSFLWVGPEGAGKKTHALALVRSLFCTEGPECPGCPTCKQVLHKTHPDLFWVHRDFFWSEDVKDEKKQGIVVGVAKNLTDKLNRAPFSAPCKIAIIPEADTLNMDAQNILLKTLEEPPSNTFIVLIAEKASEFLSTLLSRCRLIRFPALTALATEKILVHSYGWSRDAAHLGAAESNGNLRVAFHSQNEVWVQFQKKVCEQMDQALQGSDAIWLGLVGEYEQWEPEFLGDEELTATQRKARVYQSIFQVYIHLWSRRLAGVAVIPAGLTNLLPEQILRSLQKHQDMIKTNLNPRMIMDHLFLELKEGLENAQVDERSFMELSVQME